MLDWAEQLKWRGLSEQPIVAIYLIPVGLVFIYIIIASRVVLLYGK